MAPLPQPPNWTATVPSAPGFAWTLATLYASPLAYAHFGYEGEAYSKGGYLTRGFNDLDWLPDVPLEDSGPVVGATRK